VIGRGIAALLLVATLTSACGLVPNMDANGSACANRVGAGPRDVGVDEPGIPLDGVAGLPPVEAMNAAMTQGHVVVFHLDHTSCVCIPPPGYGPVTEGWWGTNGQLYLELGGAEPRGQMFPDGTGC
jgi:hypothetical protein